MPKVIIARWFSVHDFLPKDSDFKITRCINGDEEHDFYFMAYYWEEEKKWEFFDEEYEDSMQVTHWLNTPKIKFDIKYTMEEE